MPKFYEYKEGKLVACYDLGRDQCPTCGGQVLAYFKDDQLVKRDPCTVCSRHGYNGQDSHTGRER